MQGHVRYHLEKLALYSLPDIADREFDALVSGQSSDNHQVVKDRGRQDSVAIDFTAEELHPFPDINSDISNIIRDLSQPIPSVTDIYGFQKRLEEVLRKTALSDNDTIQYWMDSSTHTERTKYMNNLPFQQVSADTLPLEEEPSPKVWVSSHSVDANKDLLDLASEKGNLEAVRRLLEEKGAGPNSLARGASNSALQSASKGGHVEVVRLLIDMGSIPIPEPVVIITLSKLPQPEVI